MDWQRKVFSENLKVQIHIKYYTHLMECLRGSVRIIRMKRCGNCRQILFGCTRIQGGFYIFCKAHN